MEWSVAFASRQCQSTVRGDQGELLEAPMTLKTELELMKRKAESLSLLWAGLEKRGPGISEEQRSPVSGEVLPEQVFQVRLEV